MRSPAYIESKHIPYGTAKERASAVDETENVHANIFKKPGG